MHMVIMHTIIRIMLVYFYLTNAKNGAIIIKLSTREQERAKRRRKLRDKRTSVEVVQKSQTRKQQKFITKRS